MVGRVISSVPAQTLPADHRHVTLTVACAPQDHIRNLRQVNGKTSQPCTIYQRFILYMFQKAVIIPLVDPRGSGDD